MLRITATLVLLAGIVAFGAYLDLVGRTPWTSLPRRHLRDMKDRTDAPATLAPTTLQDFEALPHNASVAEYSGIERRGVSLVGYVQQMLDASDGDVHLEIATTPRTMGGPDTTYVTGEITPQWRDGSRWSYAALVQALRPNRGGTAAWAGGPRRARFGGWLLYDRYDHVPSQYSRQHGARSTGWEIHPVTTIELWDDSLAAWVPLPR